MHPSRSSANAPRLPSFLEMQQNPGVLLTFGKVQDPLRLPRRTTSEQKVVRACGAFNILTWNMLRTTTACAFSTPRLKKMFRSRCALCILTSVCASRHSGVHFFDISTSKSAPILRCVVHFDLETRFALQCRALFRHLDFQKWSEAEVFCTL